MKSEDDSVIINSPDSLIIKSEPGGGVGTSSPQVLKKTLLTSGFSS